MRPARRLLLLFATVPGLLLMASPARAATPARHSVAVPGITGGSGYDPAALGTVEELLLAALHRTGALTVTGQSDIARLLGLERQRQMLGCEDSSCLAEISGALGVDWVAAADLGRLGSVSILSLKLIDARRATVVWRGTRSVKDDAAIPQVAEELAGELVEAIRAAAGGPSAARDRPFAVRVGAGTHTGILGIGAEYRHGLFALGLGSGTHLLSGGVSFVPRRGAGPYVSLHATWVRSGLVTLQASGVGLGATVGWDLRPAPWFSIKAGIGAAWNNARSNGPLVFDLCAGPVF